MTTREAALREKLVEAKLLAENVLDSFKTGDGVRMDCVESARRLLAAFTTPPSPVEQARERVIEAAQEARHNDDCVFWRPHKTGTTPWPCNCALGKALAALDAARKGEL